MKKILLLCIALIYTFTSNAQRNADLGIFAGTSYYLGELNPSGHYRYLNPNFGLVYRHNFNPHHSLRWNLNYAGVSANGAGFDYLYPNTTFSTYMVEMGFQFEFNFMPFKPYTRFFQQSPYVSGGIGMSILTKPGGTGYEPVLPFGIGWKMNLGERWAIAAAWEFRKTFFDDMDGVVSLTDPDAQSLIHNNDWYSFAGLVITYNLFKQNMDCPAYGDY